MTNALFFILSILSAAISAMATEVCIRYALRRNLLDHPNERSSHSQPVPRVGGVGILLGFFLPLLAGWGMHAVKLQNGYGIMLALAGMAAIGLWDDLRSLAPPAKYALQLAIAAGLIAQGMVVREVAVPGVGAIGLGWLAAPLTLVWLTGFPNFFNFMDGINGMAGGTGAIYGGFLAAFAWLQGRVDLAVVALLLAGSSLGFLFYNFPRARTFMGDTGSMFLGLGTAMLVVMLTQRRAEGWLAGGSVPMLILCSVFIYDCVVTIARRLKRGENIFRAHRSHHYQRLAQAGWSHTRVSSLYFGMHFVAGMMGLVYLRGNDAVRWGALAAVVAMLGGLTGLVIWVERGFAGAKARAFRAL